MNKKFGDDAENFVAKGLEGQGWEILEQNYHSREGEIDIIAREKNEYVFIEVKARKNEKFGTGASAVDSTKLNKIIKTSQKYLTKNNISSDIFWRVDVAEVGIEKDKLFLKNYHKNVTQI